MSTLSIPTVGGTPSVPQHLPEPPPNGAHDPTRTEPSVGWVDGATIGFRGFADELEAMNAAWVAHRTLSRRLALRAGRRPIPVYAAPLSLERSEDDESILADGQPIARLVRPGADSRSGDSFGFEIRLPEPVDEAEARATAAALYRTLRRSGVRWAIWARERPPRAPSERVEDDAPGVKAPARPDTSRWAARALRDALAAVRRVAWTP